MIKIWPPSCNNIVTCAKITYVKELAWHNPVNYDDSFLWNAPNKRSSFRPKWGHLYDQSPSLSDPLKWAMQPCIEEHNLKVHKAFPIQASKLHQNHYTTSHWSKETLHASIGITQNKHGNHQLVPISWSDAYYKKGSTRQHTTLFAQQSLPLVQALAIQKLFASFTFARMFQTKRNPSASLARQICENLLFVQLAL